MPRARPAWHETLPRARLDMAPRRELVRAQYAGAAGTSIDQSDAVAQDQAGNDRDDLLLPPSGELPPRVWLLVGPRVDDGPVLRQVLGLFRLAAASHVVRRGAHDEVRPAQASSNQRRVGERANAQHHVQAAV